MDSDTNGKQVIVMTGATSGIGAAALTRLVAQPNTQIIIGARANREVAGILVLPLDLSSLGSVRTFAQAVNTELGSARIDMLVLNAGAQFRQPQRSVDGFELTFAVNHLSHYLLARLLMPRMAEGGRLVITTSDVHRLRPLAPKTLDPEALAHPAPDFRIAQAYPASKLCNVLTARSFAALDDVRERRITVVAYDPGFTGGTGLAGVAALERFVTVLRPVLRFVSLLIPPLYMHTPQQSGEILTQLALGEAKPPAGKIYASHVRSKVTFRDPSDLALNDDARDLLWRESAAMVDLPI